MYIQIHLLAGVVSAVLGSRARAYLPNSLFQEWRQQTVKGPGLKKQKPSNKNKEYLQTGMPYTRFKTGVGTGFDAQSRSRVQEFMKLKIP